MKITYEEFNKLFSDNVTKKEYDAIIEKIDLRFAEIMYTLKPSLKQKGWFDYSNCDTESENSGGYFDPKRYNPYIGITGESCELPSPYCDEFPTRWLWEDFEEEFKKVIIDQKIADQKFKDEEKKKREEQLVKKKQIIYTIKGKLTKEELKYVTFK